jgi:hypothetical protein
MKTTLNISDAVMQELRVEAAQEQKTLSSLVESALRLLLQTRKTTVSLPPIPTFDSGGARVNVANRDALYDIMENG